MRARQRDDDLLRMQRLARNGGTAGLLRWLAGRADGWAGIAGSDGTLLSASGAPPSG
ncbi:hypothetical protein GT040_03990, partial [Streptomyces sp. SID2119]|nr:hypothetical protein [Streptomyces sp. SID2119]